MKGNVPQFSFDELPASGSESGALHVLDFLFLFLLDFCVVFGIVVLVCLSVCMYVCMFICLEVHFMVLAAMECMMQSKMAPNLQHYS